MCKISRPPVGGGSDGFQLVSHAHYPLRFPRSVVEQFVLKLNSPCGSCIGTLNGCTRFTPNCTPTLHPPHAFPKPHHYAFSLNLVHAHAAACPSFYMKAAGQRWCLSVCDIIYEVGWGLSLTLFYQEASVIQRSGSASILLGEALSLEKSIQVFHTSCLTRGLSENDSPAFQRLPLFHA